MSQIFHHSSNTFARITMFGAVFILGFVAWAFGSLDRSTYMSRATNPREQPVPFSHAHHVGGLGIDCRYCHTGVEVGRHAGLPATEVCMTCHSQLWTGASVLAPVRESLASGKPLVWNRVARLPDYVYFDHSIH